MASVAACAPANTLRAAVDGAWVDVHVRQALISPGGCGTAPPAGTSCPSDALTLSDGNADASQTYHSLLIYLGAGSPGETITLPHPGIDVRYYDARLPAPAQVGTLEVGGPSMRGQLHLDKTCGAHRLCGSFAIDFTGAHPVSLRGRFDVPEPSAEARRIP